MDIRLPKQDGWEVLRQLRRDQRTHDLPVIIISGSIFEQELETATALGANACLSKPVQIGPLREALNKCGFVWAIAEPAPV